MAEFGDVIILVPGIFGSRLEREDGTLLYDLTVAGLPRTLWTLGGKGLSQVNPNAPPDDGVVATDLFNYQLLPGFFGNDDYDALVAMLRDSVKQPDRQVIKFPYDWRASNRWSAERLDRVARSNLKSWQDASGNAEAKLWLVCHSMGGLVARYFCEHLGGADITRELITIGTPHRGAAIALDVLVNGMRLAGLVDVSRFVRSMPSAYELLPQYPVLRDRASGTAVRLADVYGLGDRLQLPRSMRHGAPPDAIAIQTDGLPNVDRGMFERALNFHAAIRDPVVRRVDAGMQPPYELRCLLNRRQPTVLSALLSSGSLKACDDDPLAPANEQTDLTHRGDGTVPAFSAIPIEWGDTSGAVAVAAKHVGMPASGAAIDVLRNWIRPLDARAHLGGGIDDRDVLGLQVPSAIRQGDVLTVTVDALTPANVTVTRRPVAGHEPAFSTRLRLPGSGQSKTVELGTTAAGSWRVAVTAEDRRRPEIFDYVVVLDNG